MIQSPHLSYSSLFKTSNLFDPHPSRPPLSVKTPRSRLDDPSVLLASSCARLSNKTCRPRVALATPLLQLSECLQPIFSNFLVSRRNGDSWGPTAAPRRGFVSEWFAHRAQLRGYGLHQNVSDLMCGYPRGHQLPKG